MTRALRSAASRRGLGDEGGFAPEIAVPEKVLARSPSIRLPASSP